ncbi:MAG: UDP-N-acetylmuramate dehydrogenase [Christensenellales bacterium]
MDFNIDRLKRQECIIAQNQKNMSAFKSGGRIEKVIYPTSIRGLVGALDYLYLCGKDWVVVGNGTNVLFPDTKYRKIVICTKKASKFVVDGNLVYASCGASLGAIAAECKRIGLSGLERLHGIPATIGGAIAMNAGAFGGSIGQLTYSVDVWQEGQVKTILGKDIDWQYRSVDLGGGVVLGAQLQLTRSTSVDVSVSQKYYDNKRERTQPKGITLGSVFKNPSEGSAGKLIESAGMKGYSVGGAVVSEKHANFIVNSGGATSSDFIALAKKVKEQVDKCTGIDLEYEVRILK